MKLPSPAGEGTSASLILTEVSPHDKPWVAHRRSAEKVTQLFKEAEYQKLADRVNSCSQRLCFVLSADEEGEAVLRLYSSRFCRVRHCPVCQWRRSLMWRARFLGIVPRLTVDHPTARFIFLTLTVKNVPLDELRTTLIQMNAAWKRLSERKQFPAMGFVKSVEVTRNQQTGEAHPHFHCVLMVPGGYFAGQNYISQPEWRKLWQECLRVNYLPVVHVKAVKYRGSQTDVDPNKGLIIALCETLKYSVKPEDLISSVDWLTGITNQLHKTRAISVGGILKEYLSEEDPEDLISAEGNVSEELKNNTVLVFDWDTALKTYRESNIQFNDLSDEETADE